MRAVCNHDARVNNFSPSPSPPPGYGFLLYCRDNSLIHAGSVRRQHCAVAGCVTRRVASQVKGVASHELVFHASCAVASGVTVASSDVLNDATRDASDANATFVPGTAH